MTRLLPVALAGCLAGLLQTRDCGGASPAAAPPVTPAPSALPSPSAVPAPSPVPVPTEVPDLFATVARPVLRTRCAPCHEPGGKMYGRLPFDDPKVVSSHGQKVLGRLKGEDRQSIERWLASVKP